MALRIFDKFPGANVRVLTVVQAPESEVVFTPDPRGGPEAMWFDFCVEDRDPPDPPPETLALTLRFYANLLGGHDDPQFCRPVIRFADKNWNRLPAPAVRRLDDGQPILQWQVPYPSTRMEIALSHPYMPNDLRGLMRRSKGYWHEEAIGLTQGGRILNRLDNLSQISARSGKARGLYLLARQHAGETPGSWVLDGILDGVSRRRSGPDWCVWAVPFADLDGVLEGRYGKDAYPYDLNRAWGRPPMRHETLAMQRDMRRWAALCRPELVLDLHAPAIGEHEGAYLFRSTGSDNEVDRATQAWINVLQQELPTEYAAENFVRTANYPSRWNTPRVSGFVRDTLECPALSLEVPYALCGTMALTPKKYREIGRHLARAILSRWQ